MWPFSAAAEALLLLFSSNKPEPIPTTVSSGRRIGLVSGSTYANGQQFLDWTLDQNGNIGSIEYDNVLKQDVFKITGTGTSGEYATLTKDLDRATDDIVIRLIFELEDGWTNSSQNTHFIRLYNSGGASLIGTFGLTPSGETVVQARNSGFLASPQSTGDLRTPGIREIFFVIRRNSSTGFVGCFGNVGSNNISRLNLYSGDGGYAFSRIEVGVKSTGTFTGTARIISVDVFDFIPDELSLIYPIAGTKLVAGVPGIIEVEVPDTELEGSELTYLKLDDTNINVTDVNGTREDAKTNIACLVDSVVFTDDDMQEYDGAFVKFTSNPAVLLPPVQIIGTQSSGSKAFLSSFHGALGIEDTTYNSNSQSCEAQNYTIQRCYMPDPANPRRRWIGIPGSLLTGGEQTLTIRFSETPATTLTLTLNVEVNTPSIYHPMVTATKGHRFALGCEGGLLSQTQLLRELSSPTIEFYNAIYPGLMGFNGNMAWSVIQLLNRLKFRAACKLWDTNTISDYTFNVCKKILDLSKICIIQNNLNPWLFTSDDSDFTSDGGTTDDMLPEIFSRFTNIRKNNTTWSTALSGELLANINSVFFSDLYSTESESTEKAIEFWSDVDQLSNEATLHGITNETIDKIAIVSGHVKEIGDASNQTTIDLILAMIVEAKLNGYAYSSLYSYLMEPEQVAESLGLGFWIGI